MDVANMNIFYIYQLNDILELIKCCNKNNRIG